MIIRPDGHNVFPTVIEQVLFLHQAVDNCSVVGMKNSDTSSGKWPVAHIVLKPEYRKSAERIEKEIMELMSMKLPGRDRAEKIFFHDNLPLTPIDKVDYRKLEEYV